MIDELQFKQTSQIIQSKPNQSNEDYSQSYNINTYKLYNILSAAKKLGNPHLKLCNNVYVTGTNGKGSTIAFLKSILVKSGLKVNVFTSPHIKLPNERIIINNEFISNEYLKELFDRIDTISTAVSWFEKWVLAAYLSFVENPADINIIEVGIGARLDATNIIEKALCSIITSISIDHTDYLGETIEKITHEKAYVIKPKSVCFVSYQNKKQIYDILENFAKQQNSEIFQYNSDFFIDRNSEINEKNSKENKIWNILGQNHKILCENLAIPSLIGEHQFENASTAVMAAVYLRKFFPISDQAINLGLSNAKIPARLDFIEKFGYKFILDGAHNVGGAQVLSNWIANNCKTPKCLILSMKRDKDIDSFLEKILINFSSMDLIVCVDINVLGLEFFNKLEILNLIKVKYPHLNCLVSDDILSTIKQYQDNFSVICTGSLFLAANIYNLLDLNIDPI